MAVLRRCAAAVGCLVGLYATAWPIDFSVDCYDADWGWWAHEHETAVVCEYDWYTSPLQPGKATSTAKYVRFRWDASCSMPGFDPDDWNTPESVVGREYETPLRDNRFGGGNTNTDFTHATERGGENPSFFRAGDIEPEYGLPGPCLWWYGEKWACETTMEVFLGITRVVLGPRGRISVETTTFYPEGAFPLQYSNVCTAGC